MGSEDRKADVGRSKDSVARSIAKAAGPGIITGASDDDPSGIATYSQAGARFGFGMLWMALFQYPLMTAVQEMCARIGLLTGDGLAAVIRRQYSRKVAFPLAGLLLIANTFNIGADIGAMAASARLIFPQVPFFVASIAFAAFVISSEVIIPYHRYVKVLKFLTLFLLAYVITAVIAGGKWEEMLVASLVPHAEFNASFTMMFVALFGTTISPYLFFWQASEEAEEEVDKGMVKEISDPGEPRISKKEVKMMRADVVIGMAFSQIIMWAIISTTAGTLHANGLQDVQTAEQAASALEPLVKSFPNAGEIAKTIFALGIIGTGLLAVPVLAGSSGYALADVFGWKQGLNKKFNKAKSFYLVIVSSTLIGLCINLSSVDPIKALVYAAVINGVIAVPILFTVLRIANDKKILGNRTNKPLSNVLGWTTLIIMGASVVTMFLTWVK